MKAIVHSKYGLPENVLQIREVEKPSPKDKEVLIKIHATAINDYDWSMVTGKPLLYRLIYGLGKPKHPTMGMELAGVVEAVGPNVEKHKVGDAVYGDISDYGFGSFTEYVSINENAVLPMPGYISFEEAAAIPHASLLALQGLRDKGNIDKGQNVLINGGGGGVGTIGLQIAKIHDCEVTGVDSGEKIEMMKSVGFDHTINYKRENFTKNGVQYDLILDCKSNKPPFSYLRSLKPKGRYITIGGKLTTLLNILFWGNLFKLFTSKKLQILTLKPNKGLDEIGKLFKQGKIKCVLDGPYALEEVPRLLQYFGEGEHKGKIIVNLEPKFLE